MNETFAKAAKIAVIALVAYAAVAAIQRHVMALPLVGDYLPK